jgi:putative oxidoreductase
MTAGPSVTTPSAPPATRNRPRVALLAARIVLAVVFVLAAYTKFSGQKEMVDGFTQIGAGQWLRYFVATCEVAGGIGVLVPRLRALAAAGLVGLMIGATIVNIFVLKPVVAPVTVLLALIAAWVAWQERPVRGSDDD